MALKESNGTHELEDVLSEIVSGQKQLWVDGSSAIVTQLCPYPRFISIEMFLIGGEMGEIKLLAKEITDHARICGIKRAQIAGRGGWEKALGFESQGSFMVKDI